MKNTVFWDVALCRYRKTRKKVDGDVILLEAANLPNP
jgi:hypothetical protein